jgi:large repetitive protein
MGGQPILRRHIFRVSPFILGSLLLILFAWQPTNAQQTVPLPLPGQPTPPARYYAPRAVGFSSPRVLNTNGLVSFLNPTSLQFGPDARLYVSEKLGNFYALTVVRDNNNDSYRVTAVEPLPQIKNIPNYDDDGELTTTPAAIGSRQITGFYVTGSFDQPILYVTSSDPRSGHNTQTNTGYDVDLDTNSGMVTRMTKINGGWDVVHLVRGLPRSEEYHATNGIVLDPDLNVLYVAQGGNTNRGAPGRNFAFTSEYALSGAVLSIDLNVINALPVKTDGNGQRYLYDLPTLDDPTRGTPGQPDPGDPFGGNDGLNQALLVPDGPVKVYSPGYRNPYDLVLTQELKNLYTFDNGPNNGWGGLLQSEGPQGNCTAQANDDNTSSYNDNLHRVTLGHYGGHPNPVRGNPDGAGLYRYFAVPYTNNPPADATYDFTADWSPVPFNMANAIECDFRASADVEAPNNGLADDGSIYQINGSTNGMVEYLANNFGGEMKGDILAASYAGYSVRRLQLNSTGTQVTSHTTLFSGFGGEIPLDVTAQGDYDIFPGTVWVANFLNSVIIAFDPTDFIECIGGNNNQDEDFDGFTNADEIANGTNPCSGGSRPNDFDGDHVSDLNDPDDDNDARNDVVDAFAIDATNGQTVNIPFDYPFFNDTPGVGFYGLGYTGLMTNGSTDYLDQYDPANLTAGGATGRFTIDNTSSGSAVGNSNNQQNAFQMGVNISSQSPRVNLESRLEGSFFSSTPVNGQYHGISLGTGDQSNFLMIALIPNSGSGGMWVYQEIGDTTVVNAVYGTDVLQTNLLSLASIDVRFKIDPGAGFAQPQVRFSSGDWTSLGNPLAVPASWLNPGDATGLALTLIASSGNSGTPFTATWDYFKGEFAGGVVVTPTPETPTPETPTPETPVPTTPAPGTELLVNGGFEAIRENDKPDHTPWELVNETGDKIKCNKEDKTFAYSGNCAFRFKGGEGSSKLKQEIAGTSTVFHTGDRLDFSLMVNASNASINGKVKVIVSYNDASLEKSKIKFGLSQTAGYEPRGEGVNLTSGDVKKIKVLLIDKSTGGKLYLDNVSLNRTSVGQPVLMSLPFN